ncbi:MAG: archaemetzincin family Zn-dependent metalloprotease [Promethearchaeota archaeon]
MGKVKLEIVEYLQNNLIAIFKNIFTEIRIINEICRIPKNSYDLKRKQYLSPLILLVVRNYTEKHHYDKILGITALDLFVAEHNFVFGQAEFGSHAKAALISLYRLYPEFYRLPSNKELFLLRIVKEGLHEIGHTLGLEHCHNKCIMIFSNSIFDTDKKPAAFCEKCWGKIL